MSTAGRARNLRVARRENGPEGVVDGPQRMRWRTPWPGAAAGLSARALPPVNPSPSPAARSSRAATGSHSRPRTALRTGSLEDARRFLARLALPLARLVRMRLTPRCNRRRRPILPQRLQRHMRLETRRGPPSLRHGCSPADPAKQTLAHCPKRRRQLSPACRGGGGRVPPRLRGGRPGPATDPARRPCARPARIRASRTP